MKEIYLGSVFVKDKGREGQEKVGKAFRPWYRIEACGKRARRTGVWSGRAPDSSALLLKALSG